ncbi:Ubiquitin--protein ligase [Bertholletia excelsa]
MHDANDAESLDDEFYSGDTVIDSDEADTDYEFIDNDSDESEDVVFHRLQKNYTILSEADIHQRQVEDMMKISTVLSIPTVAAGILLRHYNWSVSKVHDEWFAHEEKVRDAIGLLEKPVALPDAKESTCGICFEIYPRERMSAAACGHAFCGSCWQGLF